MRPDAICQLLRKQPFRPFRVYVSDGVSTTWLIRRRRRYRQ